MPTVLKSSHYPGIVKPLPSRAVANSFAKHRREASPPFVIRCAPLEQMAWTRVFPVFSIWLDPTRRSQRHLAIAVIGSASSHLLSRDMEDRLWEFDKLQSTTCPSAMTHLVEVETMDGLEVSIERVLTSSVARHAIIFMCASAAIRTRLLKHLGLPRFLPVN